MNANETERYMYMYMQMYEYEYLCRYYRRSENAGIHYTGS